MFTTSLVILTIVILGYSLIPVLADFNQTHATNPLWTGHARYHVVWQVCSYVGIGIISLGLLWIPGDGQQLRAHLVAALALCIYGGFFTAAATMRLYDGKLNDTNGWPSIALPGGRSIDRNLAVFIPVTVLLFTGWALLAAS